MIELIERTLLSGGNLEDARSTLLNAANIERNRMNELIEHDYKVATLIRECLLTEPRGSGGYAVSKGIMNRLREQYRDNQAEKLVRRLNREARKELNNDGNNEEARKPSDSAGTAETTVG